MKTEEEAMQPNAPGDPGAAAPEYTPEQIAKIEEMKADGCTVEETPDGLKIEMSSMAVAGMLVRTASQGLDILLDDPLTGHERTLLQDPLAMVLEQLELTEQTPMMALAGAVLVIGTNKTLNWYNKRAARLEREAKAQRKDELRAKKADKEANKKPANKRKK